MKKFFAYMGLMVVLIVAGPSASAADEFSANNEEAPQGYEWEFVFPISGDADSSSPNRIPRAFGYGICKGYFQDLTKQGNYLAWGAQSSCTASNNLFFLHQVKVILRDSCSGIFCLVYETTKTIYSPSSSNYSRVATANGFDYCVGNAPQNTRSYEQWVYVTIRSVTYGPFFQNRTVSNCDINP